MTKLRKGTEMHILGMNLQRKLAETQRALRLHHELLERLRTTGKLEHGDVVQAVTCLHAYNGSLQ